MKDLTQALRELTGMLDSLSVPYAVMGGMAVRVHGIPRPTHDVDFTIALRRERLPDLFALVIDAGYSVAEPHLQGWVDNVAGMPLVKIRMHMEDHGIDIDIFLAESEFQKSLVARRQRETLEGHPIWFVTPEDLVLLKLIAGRPRDFVDVQDVLFTQGELDNAYLRRWAGSLGVADRLEQALREWQE